MRVLRVCEKKKAGGMLEGRKDGRVKGLVLGQRKENVYCLNIFSFRKMKKGIIHFSHVFKQKMLVFQRNNDLFFLLS